MAKQYGPAASTDRRDPTPISIGFPGSFTVGQTQGNITCVDPYTARITLSPPLILGRELEAHLISASIPYTYPQIGGATDGIPGFPAGDNVINITWDGGARTAYAAPVGLYEYTDVAAWLNSVAVTEGWIASITSAPLFTFTGITATQKLILTVNPASLAGGVFPASGVTIDFVNPTADATNDSMGPILGWPTSGGGATLTIAGGGGTPASFAAPNEANLALYSSFIVYLSCCRDSGVNGYSSTALYQFQLGGQTPNSVASYTPPLPFPVPVASASYAQLDLSFTDQSGNKLLLKYLTAAVAISFIIAKTKADGSV